MSVPRVGRLVLRGFQKKQSLVRPKQKRTQPKKFSILSSQQEEVENAIVPLETKPIRRFEPHTAIFEIGEFIRPNDELRKCIEGFLLDQRSKNTQIAYAKDIKRFVKFLLVRKYQKGPEKLDRAIVVAYKDWLLSEGLEHTTVDRHLSTLKSLFRWMMDEGVIERNPAERVRFLKPKRLSSTVGFTDAEVKRILNLPNLHKKSGAQHYAILMILFYCGLRRSELVSLKTSYLTVERGRHVLRLRGKGNQERIIPLIAPVWHAIQYYSLIHRKTLSEDQFLFTPLRNNRTGVKNKPLDSSSIFYIVRHYARKAGISSKVSPHSCRATAISNARDHQVSDRAIQEFAGWASTEMITRYDKRKTAVENSAALSIQYGDEEEKKSGRVPSWVSAEDRPAEGANLELTKKTAHDREESDFEDFGK